MQKGGNVLSIVSINPVQIGERLRLLRGAKTIEEVADNLKISSSAIGMYERGCRVPRDDIKVQIAKYYGKSVQEIFFD